MSLFSNILTGVLGVGETVLGGVTGNPALIAGGLGTATSVLSPHVTAPVQQGISQYQYQQAMNNQPTAVTTGVFSMPVWGWVALGLVAFLLIFKRKIR